MNRRRIEELVDQGYIAKKTKGSLSLYNYTAKTQYEGFWVAETLMCRGLILDSNDRVVARPFDKFFNWGERGRTTDAPIVSVTEKLDGSLGCLYWDKGWHVATRGSFDSDQALWATDYFNKMFPNFPVFPVTYLFEIIYPENRIVVDYGGAEDLVLLAIRDNESGDYAPYGGLIDIQEMFGFRIVPRHRFGTPDDIATFCARLDSNHEGFVAEFADGQRFKFKGAAYVELHRIISGLSYKSAVDAVASGSAEQVREIVPEELREQWDEWVYDIGKRKHGVEMEVERAFREAVKATRKDYALWVQDNVPHLAPYMFLRLDERDYRSLIFRREFADG